MSMIKNIAYYHNLSQPLALAQLLEEKIKIKLKISILQSSVIKIKNGFNIMFTKKILNLSIIYSYHITY